jgi:3-dehydroquinate dehydratase type I
MPKTAAEAQRLIDKAEKAGADIVEVRLDRLDDVRELANLAAHGEKPKIATNKLAVNHGCFAGTEGEQKKILLDAAKHGFQYVDIELSASNLKEFTTETSEYGAKPIVSFHDFEGMMGFSRLDRVLEQEVACGADVCKIVMTAKCPEDNLALLSFTSAASKRANTVCFAMGEAGKISRLLSPLFGGFFTFASLGRGAETAPGQMSIDEMKAAYKLLGI